MTTDPAKAQTSQGALRSALVLEAVAGKEWSLSALARHLDVERRTLGRVVSGLEQEGFVSRNRAGLLQPGPRFVAAARSVTREHGLVALAGDVVADLCEMTGCTSVLHLPHGDYLFPEVVVTSPNTIGVSMPPGRSIELWRGVGRAFLLYAGASDIRRLSAMSPHQNLVELLDRERELGFAVSHGELVPNVTAIGAAVLDGERPVAVLAVIGLDPDLPLLYGDLLLGSAARLTRLLSPSQ